MYRLFFALAFLLCLFSALTLDTLHASPQDAPVAQTTTTSATGTVSATFVNLRAGPGTTFARVGNVSLGQRVSITGSQTNSAGELWYRLEGNAWIRSDLVAGVRTVQAATATTTPTPTAAPRRFSTVGMIPTTVTNIVDGDTIDVRIGASVFRLRYIGMDTPERGQNLFAESTAANRALVFGKTVYLERDISNVDPFDRLLRYVYLADGTFVNAELVRQGWAVAATYPPDVKYQETIRQAQQEAVAAAVGMWAIEAGATAAGNANLRGGPGTNYPVVGSVSQGQALDVVARNPAGDWLQLGNNAWIYASLVNDAPTGLQVATNIPAPPVVAAPAAQPAAPAAPAAVQPAASQPAGTAKVVISTVFYDGVVYRVESDEYAVISNVGTTSINIGGWRLNAGDNGQDFRFPSYELAPGQSCRVYTNEYHPESCGFTFGKSQAIWNNKGDCGLLYDSNGAEVSRFCY